MQDFDNLKHDRQLAIYVNSYIIASNQLQKLDFSRVSSGENRPYKKEVLIKQHETEQRLTKYVAQTYLYELKGLDIIMLCRVFGKVYETSTIKED